MTFDARRAYARTELRTTASCPFRNAHVASEHDAIATIVAPTQNLLVNMFYVLTHHPFQVLSSGVSGGDSLLLFFILSLLIISTLPTSYTGCELGVLRHRVLVLCLSPCVSIYLPFSKQVSVGRWSRHVHDSFTF